MQVNICTAISRQSHAEVNCYISLNLIGHVHRPLYLAGYVEFTRDLLCHLS